MDSGIGLIILAMVAVFLVARLYRVLGRRTGNERRRDPFAGAANDDQRRDTVLPMALRLWAFAAKRPVLYRFVASFGARLLKMGGGHAGRLRRLPLAGGWTAHRDMLMPAFFAADLAAGRLVQPFDLLATDGDSYWLVYAQERHNVPKIRAFREWILAEVKRDAERAAE